MTAINTMEPSLLRYAWPGLPSAPRDTGTCR